MLVYSKLALKSYTAQKLRCGENLSLGKEPLLQGQLLRQLNHTQVGIHAPQTSIGNQVKRVFPGCEGKFKISLRKSEKVNLL